MDDGGEEVLLDGNVSAHEQVRGCSTSTIVHALTRQMIEACDALGIHAGSVVRDGIGVEVFGLCGWLVTSLTNTHLTRHIDGEDGVRAGTNEPSCAPCSTRNAS